MIARRFIKALENIADSRTYTEDLIVKSSVDVAKRNLKDRTVEMANIVYFDRYIDLYEEEIGDQKFEYESQIRCRKEKNAVIRYYFTEEQRIEDNTQVQNQLSESNNIGLETKDLINALKEYSKKASDLDEKTLILTEKTTKEAKWSRYIAIGTLIITLTALILNNI